MEYVQKLIEAEVRSLLLKAPAAIPLESSRIMGPIANSLKLAARMVPGFPRSDLKGLPWLFGVLGDITPGLIAGLTEQQIRGAAYKILDLTLKILDGLPPEQEDEGYDESGSN